MVAELSSSQFTPTASAGRLGRTLPVLFLLVLVFPLEIQISTLALTPSRIFLVILFVPLLVGWVGGRYDGFRAADFLLLGYVFWVGLSYLVNTGSKGIEFVGITTIETFGSYLLARAFVRSSADLDRVARALFIIISFMVPAAIIESITTVRIYSQIIEMIGTTFAWVDYPPRWGFYRAQVVFEHPILYGIFCSMAFSLLYWTVREKTGRISGIWRGWVSIVATFFSFSSGALLALMVQIGLVAWERGTRFLKSRWWILLSGGVAGYIVIDLLSNRTPFEVFASYMTFNSGTAFNRILIFKYGVQNVWNNPIFGLGNRMWVRPNWMVPSVDNIWLLTAMRYGIPGFVMFVLTFATITVRLALLPLQDVRANLLRRTLVFTLVGTAFGMATVHLWGATFMMLMFIMGAASRFSSTDTSIAPTKENAETLTESNVLTRTRYKRSTGSPERSRERLSRYTRQQARRDS